MTDFTIDDMIKQAKDENALDFGKSFDTLIKDKLVAAINNKKEQVAKSMFADEQQEPVEAEAEDNEEGDEAETETELENQESSEEETDTEEEQDNGEES